ncbi:hypothetical protein [Streptomyces sp. NPDC001315]|uniref:hypothetical protein n=1 Tax=Streptomyces sp. NPDC001315 TaxID=3364562 RepID=UPI00369CE180
MPRHAPAAPETDGPLWGHAADYTRDRLSAYCPADVAWTVARRFLGEAHAIDTDAASAAKVYGSWGALVAVLGQLLDAFDAEDAR